MLNISVIIGSRNKKSRNYTLTNRLINKLDNNVSVEIITPYNYPILECQGCCKCFITGECILDGQQNDKGDMMKEKLRSSDIIIFNSPVYAHSVSSDIKKIIDRTSYWLHIFELLGKQAFIMTTTDSNGAEFVNEYLYKMATHYGLVVPIVQTFYRYTSEKHEEKMLEHVVEQINNTINGQYKPKATPHHEACFQYYRFIFSNRDEDNAETMIWRERNFLEAESFSELLEKRLMVLKDDNVEKES